MKSDCPFTETLNRDSRDALEPQTLNTMNSESSIKPHSHSPAGRLFAVLAILTLSAAAVLAEDVCVTSYVSTGMNTCDHSCPYNLGTGDHSSLYHSIACTNSRNSSVYGTATTATWKVTPTLATSNGIYKIFITKGRATDCSPDIIVSVATTDGALSDASGAPLTTVPTTAFQATNSVDSWTLVGYLASNTNHPAVFFTYASGTLGANARFYMDAVEFESVDAIIKPAPPTRISQILYGNSLSIAGTGPTNHPFALVSSTNLTSALTNWTAEQTNTDGIGTFSFTLDPGPASARFFQVITQ